jgi:ferredoxin-thioredoxin reductase catalytic chain
MNNENTGTESVDILYDKLNKDAESSGYHLNPDVEFTRDLVRSLIINTNRYGYQACPCRLASGTKTDDLDIICPCDYRDADVAEFGTCYCGLYVSKDVVKGKKKVHPIPERRPEVHERKTSPPMSTGSTHLAYTVWRCNVCGYLCARDAPPEICPICKADKDRFKPFM